MPTRSSGRIRHSVRDLQRVKRETWNWRVTKFAEVVRLQPGIAEGHEALGAVLFELGKTSEGLVQFEAAAKLKPGDELSKRISRWPMSMQARQQSLFPISESAQSVEAAGSRCGQRRVS